MKKHISVWMLYLRSSVYRLMVILAAMALIELVGFYLPGFDLIGRFGQTVYDRFLSVVFLLAFFACCCICIGPGKKGSSVGDTLQRLQISERSVFLWHTLSNICCFLVLWCMQILLLFVLSLQFQHSASYTDGAQGILLAFYRSSFLHAVLPLEELSLWIRNGIFVLSAAIACAFMPLSIRHGGREICGIVALTFLAPTFPAAIGSGCEIELFSTVFQGAMAMLNLALALYAAHNGKEQNTGCE